jgi:hypothetical protein
MRGCYERHAVGRLLLRGMGGHGWAGKREGAGSGTGQEDGVIQQGIASAPQSDSTSRSMRRGQLLGRVSQRPFGSPHPSPLTPHTSPRLGSPLTPPPSPLTPPPSPLAPNPHRPLPQWDRRRLPRTPDCHASQRGCRCQPAAPSIPLPKPGPPPQPKPKPQPQPVPPPSRRPDVA